jgi:hypothetical protein
MNENTNTNGTENGSKIAELHKLQNDVSALIVRTLDVHNFGPDDGSGDTDALLDQLEAMYEEVCELIAA